MNSVLAALPVLMKEIADIKSKLSADKVDHTTVLDIGKDVIAKMFENKVISSELRDTLIKEISDTDSFINLFEMMGFSKEVEAIETSITNCCVNIFSKK